jgi:hypothetical protein
MGDQTAGCPISYLDAITIVVVNMVICNLMYGVRVYRYSLAPIVFYRIARDAVMKTKI